MQPTKRSPKEAGRFLTEKDLGEFRREQRKTNCRRYERWLTLAILLTWEGLLLYMLMGNLIDLCYGAVFLAAVSASIGYQLK